MATAKEMIAELNDLRVEHGLKPLTNCKDSKKVIQSKIDAMREKMAEFDAIKKGIEEQWPSKPEKASATFKVSELAKEHNINPKIARRRLRSAANLPPRSETRWEFNIEDMPQILAVIKA